jgi:hypothetical protein
VIPDTGTSFDDLRRSIGRGVIRDNDFGVRVGLRAERIQRAGKTFLAVEHREAD